MKSGFKKIIFIAVIVMMAGCSLKQEILMDQDGGGNVRFEMETAPFFYEFLNSFIDIDDTISQSRNSMEQSPAMSDVELDQDGESSWYGSFHFSELNSLLSVQGEQLDNPVFKREINSGITTLTITLNRQNFQQLTTLFPLLEDPYLASFGPEGSAGTSKTEYEDMVVWTFEDSVDDPDKIRQAFRNSYIELDLVVPGQILEQDGGELVEQNKVHFKVPLVDVLVLNDELVYTVSYR